MIDADKLISELASFTGCDTFTRWSPLSKCVATEGVIYLAENAECFWLLDIIASHQMYPKVRREEFQAWKFTGKPGGKATVVCEDGNSNVVTRQKLGFSTFPLPEITIWATLNEIGSRTLMLPSEY